MKTRTKLTTLAASLAVALALPGIAAAQTDTVTDQPSDQATDQVRDQVTDRSDRVRDREIDPAHLDRVKQHALAAIEKRLWTLDELATRVSNNGHVTDEHAAALLEDYAAASRGLSDLAEEIEAAETPEELRELIPLIAEDYRVYLVIVPKSHEVVVSDTVLDVVDRAGEAADRLQEIIDRATEAGWDPELLAEAQAAVDAMRRNLAEAEATGGPVAGSVIGLDAADWPDPAEGLLRQGRADLESARDALREARANAKAAAEAIRAAKPGDAATDVVEG